LSENHDIDIFIGEINNNGFIEYNEASYPPQVTYQITETIRNLAKNFIFYAHGIDKTFGVTKVIENPPSFGISSIIRNNTNSIIIVDEEAINELKIGTVKYYQNDLLLNPIMIMPI